MSEEDKSKMILKPKKRGPEAFILPAALAVGGAALLFSSTNRSSKSSKKESSKSSLAANEISFSKNHGSYSMGKDYEELVLEPYLAEQAEEGNLVIADDDPNTFGPINSMHKAMMKKTREDTVSAFKSTHRAKVGDEKILISNLPQDKAGVKNFNSWLNGQVKYFQENY